MNAYWATWTLEPIVQGFRRLSRGIFFSSRPFGLLFFALSWFLVSRDTVVSAKMISMEIFSIDLFSPS